MTPSRPLYRAPSYAAPLPVRPRRARGRVATLGLPDITHAPADLAEIATTGHTQQGTRP
ncbi:hypothetical protein ABZX40_30105 [Streptomyces sp. NPDC004610]|uniref:hypothetical protein n=1 Tax=unclassified Streptomyces TaxID=2593676 RepID=UPI0033AED5CC